MDYWWDILNLVLIFSIFAISLNSSGWLHRNRCRSRHRLPSGRSAAYNRRVPLGHRLGFDILAGASPRARFRRRVLAGVLMSLAGTAAKPRISRFC